MTSMTRTRRQIILAIVLSVLVVAASVYAVWLYGQKRRSEPAPARTKAEEGEETTKGAAENTASLSADSADDTKRFSSQLAAAKKLEEENDLLGAKKTYEELLPRFGNPERLQQEIYRLNIEILFSPLITDAPHGPRSEIYTVKPKDTIDKIAKDYGTTIDLIKESNGIEDPRTIQIGDRYKVVTDKFRIIVNRSKNILTLIAGDMVLKEYLIGTGEFNKTPLGDFLIRNKIVDPPWKGIPYGDERNILGTRWMGLRNEGDTVKGYGIHGTWAPQTIGKSVSQGCIRMNNKDVEELFKIVPVGTPVKIID